MRDDSLNDWINFWGAGHTGDAICFFGDFWKRFRGWSNSRPRPEDDLFRALKLRFPNTWQRLELLSTSSQCEIDTQCSNSDPFRPELLTDDLDTEGEARVTVRSGYAPTIDLDLRHVLDAIRSGDAELFYTNSFKWLTRNPEKLLKVIELLLSWNRTYVTNNYVIRSDYCARRRPLARPAHTVQGIVQAFTNKAGLVDRHQVLLQHARQTLGLDGDE